MVNIFLFFNIKNFLAEPIIEESCKKAKEMKIFEEKCFINCDVGPKEL